MEQKEFVKLFTDLLDYLEDNGVIYSVKDKEVKGSLKALFILCEDKSK